jgi:hypothetical protein
VHSRTLLSPNCLFFPSHHTVSLSLFIHETKNTASVLPTHLISHLAISISLLPLLLKAKRKINSYSPTISLQYTPIPETCIVYYLFYLSPSLSHSFPFIPLFLFWFTFIKLLSYTVQSFLLLLSLFRLVYLPLSLSFVFHCCQLACCAMFIMLRLSLLT